jgi:hypothetical protein
MMALISSIMNACFFYKLGSMDKPPAGAGVYFGLDTWVVCSTMQILLTMKSTKLFLREKHTLKMKYSSSSFFLAHWFSSFMAMKLYSVTTSTLSFWFIAMPKRTLWNWFQFVCMELVLTMCAASWG